jgi:hypothetical protein
VFALHFGFPKAESLFSDRMKFKVKSLVRGDNSFFVQIDDGTRYLWTLALSDNWQWDAINKPLGQ